jgi:hypothetical protein
MKRLMTAFAAVALGGGLALAQPAEKLAEEAFLKGNTAYNLGRFDEAVEHFTKAYEAWPQPEFLYNIAQSYRLAGNCKQSLHFYKRFRSLKETDRAAPLSPQKREEVEKFIGQLTECVAKADSSADQKPDTIDRPGQHTGTTTGTQPAGTTGTQPSGTTTTTSTSTTALANPDGDEDDDDDDDTSIRKTAMATPKLVSARLVSGIAVLRSGDLDIPVQPSFGVIGGYPLPVGPLVLELGASLSYSPLPYQAMNADKMGTMLGVRAAVSAVYPVHDNVLVRGDLGLGIVSLAGLAMGNPITETQEAGSFTLPSFRFGVAADVLITPNIAATISPFGFSYSPGADGMYADSLSAIEVLVGLGYRM